MIDVAREEKADRPAEKDSPGNLERNCSLKFLMDGAWIIVLEPFVGSHSSGGESQRIRLATRIGLQLVNVLYILDEPSIGLHPTGQPPLVINSLKALRDTGNTVVVVEHDEEMMESADYNIDMGLESRQVGGEVVFQGTPEEMLKRYVDFTLSEP